MSESVSVKKSMQKLVLNKIDHNIKLGAAAEALEPNVTTDCLLVLNDKPIGLYISKFHETNMRINTLFRIAMRELRSGRVPIGALMRKREVKKNSDGSRIYELIKQSSATIGGVPKNPMFRRNYNRPSGVHAIKSAENYMRAVILLGMEIEEIIHENLPNIYMEQENRVSKIPTDLRLSRIYSTATANYGISINYHRDLANVPNSVNSIVTDRYNSVGGCLHVPDYGIVFANHHGSLIVYPSVNNMHGVTPIIKIDQNGYRNSLIYYAIKHLIE